MDSMTNSRGVVVGVDAHTDTHDVAVLDDCGRLLARQTFAADAAGYRGLHAWIETFAPVAAIGVESTGAYAAGLVRHLRAEGLEVLEVNQPHPHTRRRRGKSDSIGAELAARHVLAANRPWSLRTPAGSSRRSASCGSRGTARVRGRPKIPIRLLRGGGGAGRGGRGAGAAPPILTWQSHASRSRAARGIHGCTTSGAPTIFGRTLKARTAALNALNGLIITAPEDLRQQLTARKTKRAAAKLCERSRPDPRRLR